MGFCKRRITKTNQHLETQPLSLSMETTVSRWDYQRASTIDAPSHNYKLNNLSNRSIQFRLSMPKPPLPHPSETLTLTQPPQSISSAFNDQDFDSDLNGYGRKRKTNQSNRNTTPPTSTPTDVLCLLDGLGLPVPTDIYVSLIRECSITGDPTQAAQLHSHIGRSGLSLNSALLNRILFMHVSCGLIDGARHMFDKMSLRHKNSISWTIMLAAYMDNGFSEDALCLFVQMLHHRSAIMLQVPLWIFICVLKACVHTKNEALGKEVHGWLLKVGYAGNLFLSSSLISFYGKFRCLDDADFVFDQTSEPDTVVWTAKMVSKCQEENPHEALIVFIEMGRAGVKRNAFTYSSVLKACGRMNDHGRCGRIIHASAIKTGLESDVYVGCGLIDMYGKCGRLTEARRVFESVRGTNKTKHLNIVRWNAMLSGYTRNGLYIEAIKFLYQMKSVGVQPQESLLNEIRIGCGSGTIGSWTTHKTKKK